MSVQQADQTPLVYPVSETNEPLDRQSDGSFGAVFIVLAVIVVVSAIACVFGRVCNKRYNKPRPSKHGRHAKKKDMKPVRNAFHTKDGDMEFGFDKRFSSAKVAANGEPNMGRPNSFSEPNMGPEMGRPNSFREPNMGPEMGRPNSFREPNMGQHSSFREPNMGGPRLFREPNMGPEIGRPNMYHEPNMGPSLGQANSFDEPSMGHPESFHQEPSMGRPNSSRKVEFRDDQMRYGGLEDQEMQFNYGTRPQYY